MFVIVTCLHQASTEETVEVRVGRALRHAATSVTVTTLTDVLAFSVGAVTVRYIYNHHVHYPCPTSIVVNLYCRIIVQSQRYLINCQVVVKGGDYQVSYTVEGNN